MDRQIGSGHRGAPWGWACEGQGQSTCPAPRLRPRCRSNRPDYRTTGRKPIGSGIDQRRRGVMGITSPAGPMPRGVEAVG
ncbi:hypothetical protein Rhow_003924 [Rhodococcus wratislaviensis]|uniref:Uncharacterized protein n=1 Tax=Rhodococcus wratislaviensis TaxID=44752 RepID=A0A402C9L0_RHOWR|nr:hypothetical protein Rhow_003924 [Rhodococcus wratislaviensis]